MKIQPKTEKQLQEEGLLPEGVYPFEVIKAEDKQSKAGNDMIELNLRVFGEGNQSVFVRDFLLESMGHKLRHAAVRIISEEVYNKGEFTAHDFQGREGWAKIGIEKDKKGEFPDKNRVLDYVLEPVPEEGKGAAIPANEEDDIPF